MDSAKNPTGWLGTRTGWRITLPALLLVGLLSCTLSGDLPDLSAEQLQTMVNDGTGVLVIDTRSHIEFARGRLPKAILIPEEKFYALELLLPTAKDTPLVFYCRGYG